MGSDIHAVLECEDEREQPAAFADGELWIPRDDALFAALAGVGNSFAGPPAVAPRGLPETYSVTVGRLFFQPVVDAEDDYTTWLEGRAFAQRAEAEMWVRSGKSFYAPGLSGPKELVSNPDYHTPSWLRLAEIEAALAGHQLQLTERSPEFQSVLAAMRELARHYGPEHVRLVFWFD